MAQILSFQNDRETETGNRPLRVGERLLEATHITRDQLQIALQEQRRNGNMLGGILVKLGFLEEEKLAAVLSERSGFAGIDLKNATIDPALLARLPKQVMERCRAIPVALHHATLEIAMADPYDIVAMDEIRRYFPRHIDLVPLVASSADIASIIDHCGDFSASIESILKEFETDADAAPDDTAWQHPVVRLVNTILFDAVKRGASDIHFEPESSFIRLRYRIDGVLHQVRALHRTHWPELSHRLKIMAGMNIADTRNLQDGRFFLQVGGADIDFRMAVMPTAEGENIVVRILDHRHALLPLEKLGFHEEALEQLRRILERPEGIVLVTGPTGSGKTTTLYSMLNAISTSEVNIMTLEEPIEYRLSLIRQTDIREQQGLGFAEGVRGILRQDPDIILIGEMRDGDTAQMALRAAMTGHQVFSTLHCNDALGALPRMLDLGLRPRMLAGNVAGIIAQRLVRKLCRQCKASRPANEDECRILRCEAANPPDLFEASGCAACGHTGYRGRTAVSEILHITPELDAMIAIDAQLESMRKQTNTHGFRSMAKDGCDKVLAGETSLAELCRTVDMTRFAKGSA